MAGGIGAVLAMFLSVLFENKALAPVRRVRLTLAELSSGNFEARTGLRGPLAFERMGQDFDALLDDRVAGLERAARDSEELNDSVIEIMQAVGEIATRKDLIFSGSSLAGHWTAPAQLHLIAVFGGVEVDLTNAVWTSDEIVIDAYAVFGGIDLKVPDGVEVVDRTFAVFGGTSVKRTSPQPTGRRVVIKGLAAFGGIDVKGPKPPKG